MAASTVTVDTGKAREALGGLAASFLWGAVDEGGGVTLTSKAISSQDVREALSEATRRLERAGFDTIAIGGRLHLASPATAAKRSFFEGSPCLGGAAADDEEHTIVDRRTPAGMDLWDPGAGDEAEELDDDDLEPVDFSSEAAREFRAFRYECGVSL